MNSSMAIFKFNGRYGYELTIYEGKRGSYKIFKIT